MAGIGNSILFAQGMRLQPSTSQDILQMRQASTDIARINYTGDPETNVAANPGSLCHDPVSGNVYVKDSGTGNTGWIQIPLPTSGTFTPVITGDIGSPTVTYGSQIGRYYRIGNLVQFNITVSYTAMSGGSGNGVIGTLPFVAENIPDQVTSILGNSLEETIQQSTVTWFLAANQATMTGVIAGSPLDITYLEGALGLAPEVFLYASGIYRV
jgi:hypothetical protein